MKTTKHFLFTMLLMTLLYVQPTQLLARDNDDHIYKQYYELEQEYKKLKKEYDQVLQEKQELEKQLKNYQHKNINTPSEKKNEAKENNSLAIDRLLKDADNLLKSQQSYSNINLYDLNSIRSKLEEAKDGANKEKKKKIDNALKELEKLSEEVDIFNKAYKVVDSPFNEKDVNDAKNKIADLKKKHDEKYNKQSGLNLLYWQLDNYKRHINFFKKALEVTKSYLSQGGDYNQFNKILQRDADLKKRIEHIKDIPYLENQWDQYEKSLQNNFKKATEITNSFIKQFSNQQ